MGNLLDSENAQDDWVDETTCEAYESGQYITRILPCPKCGEDRVQPCANFDDFYNVTKTWLECFSCGWQDLK